ncbi:MAG: sulfite exporter TauE/SafE family protein [Oligoflexia bacterium]|nr:sulfite exporter TauE/SafE family protein [Oligoflexia bacterium]
MSGLISELVNSRSFVPLAVMVASLAGSGHCVAMCGGLVAATTRSGKDVIQYHLGRLTGYLALGALAGELGAQLFVDTTSGMLSWVPAVLIGALLINMGIQTWHGGGRAPHFGSFVWLPRSVFMRLFNPALSRTSSGSPFQAARAGLLSALLPCGWLHAFVLGATTLRSPVAGAGFLLMFWLGTLPALAAAPWLVRRWLTPIFTRVPRLSSALLILAGFICIGMKLAPLAENGHAKVSAPADVICH